MAEDWWEEYLRAQTPERRARLEADAAWEADLEERMISGLRQAVAAAVERYPGVGGALDMISGHAWRLIEEMYPDEVAESLRRRPAGSTKRTISRSLRTEVFERDLYRCQQCGTHLDLTLDHIIPESAGGTDTAENLQTLCRSCNSKKGVTLPE